MFDFFKNFLKEREEKKKQKRKEAIRKILSLQRQIDEIENQEEIYSSDEHYIYRLWGEINSLASRYDDFSEEDFLNEQKEIKNEISEIEKKVSDYKKDRNIGIFSTVLVESRYLGEKEDELKHLRSMIV